MRKILCDRCNAEIESESDVVKLRIDYYDEVLHGYSCCNVDVSKELCRKCATRISEVLKDCGDDDIEGAVR